MFNIDIVNTQCSSIEIPGSTSQIECPLTFIHISYNSICYVEHSQLREQTYKKHCCLCISYNDITTTYRLPVKPSIQLHSKSSTRSRQVPRPLHVTFSQSFILVSHDLPVNPVSQVHLNAFCRLEQLPWLPQGTDAHSSISTSQCFPVQPGLQIHSYE